MKGLSRAIGLGLIFCVVCCIAGCAKDAVLGFTNAVMSTLGENVLTKGYNLTGRRTFDTDSYTGAYLAEYSAKTVREILFGSTSLERSGGNSVVLRAALTNQYGSGRLLLERDGREPEPVLESAGTIEMEIDVSPGSAYLIFEADDFTGMLDITIDDLEEGGEA